MNERGSPYGLPDYTPLARAGWLLASLLPQLYLGRDHVLYLRLQGFGEIARRFYFRDITGLRCVATRRGQVYSAVWLLLVLLPWCAMAVTLPTSPLPYYLAGFVSGVAGVGLLVNLALGPTCKAWLHTVNHTEQLLALRRYRKARHVFARLHEPIRAAREPSDASESTGRVSAFAPVSERPTVHPAFPPAGRQRLLTIVFSLSLILAASFVFDFWVNMDWKNTLDTLAMLTIALLAPLAFIREGGTECRRPARIAAGILIVDAATIVPQYLVLTLLIAVLDPNAYMENLEKLEKPAILHPGDGAVYYVFQGYLALCIALLASCGVVGLRGLRRGESD